MNNKRGYNSTKHFLMDGASIPDHWMTLVVAAVYGVLIGAFAYLMTHFPWHVTGTLLDMSEQVDLFSFLGREFVTFLQISAIWLIVFGACGGCLSFLLFAVLWRRQSKAIWTQGSILTVLLMSIPVNLVLTVTEVYIRSRHSWPPHEYTPLSLDILYSLFSSIPGLLCLIPAGIVVGIVLQRVMKARYKDNVG